MLRAAIEAHHGYVFNVAGDAFCAARISVRASGGWNWSMPTCGPPPSGACRATRHSSACGSRRPDRRTSGFTERAVRLFGAVAALQAAWHSRLGNTIDREEYERHLANTRSRLDPDEFAAAWAAGAQLTLEQAVADAEAIAADVAQSGTAAPTPAQAGTNLAGLTARELEVLRCLAEGLSNDQIAERLVVSTFAVRAHLRSIYSKLDVNSRTAAIHPARDAGLV